MVGVKDFQDSFQLYDSCSLSFRLYLTLQVRSLPLCFLPSTIYNNDESIRKINSSKKVDKENLYIAPVTD